MKAGFQEDWCIDKIAIGVVSVAILVSLPAVMGIQRLEVGFDTRDNFDESVPVVSDFILISEQFQSSPSPLYVVLDGDVISLKAERWLRK